MRRLSFLMVFFFACSILMGTAIAQDKKADPLEKWKPAFDYSKAKYKVVISNVSHPVLDGAAGFLMRDELWKRTNGQMYIDYKPFSMLGGEVEVLNQLQMGAIQGMSCSSIASTNLGPRFGIVNLPFLINSFDKLDKFIEKGGKLFDHFMMAMDHQGIMGLDITTYGNYGWASVDPIRTLDDLKKVKFRIGEAAVNKLTYEAWGVKPVVMPWPDVPIALKQGVITALDHTLVVMNITKKFEVAKYFTQVDFAQGLFIWIFNKAWFNSLPKDLQKTFVEVVHEVCKKCRPIGAELEKAQIEDARKTSNVEFIKLPDADMATLRKQGDAVHKKYAEEINKNYPGDSYKAANFLKEVQDFMGYKP